MNDRPVDPLPINCCTVEGCTKPIQATDSGGCPLCMYHFLTLEHGPRDHLLHLLDFIKRTKPEAYEEYQKGEVTP